MKTIYKYRIGPQFFQTFDMPTGFRVRHVAPVGPVTELGINIWAEVDTDNELVPIYWRIVGTGFRVPPLGTYCGTVVVDDGFVWHVFVES